MQLQGEARANASTGPGKGIDTGALAALLGWWHLAGADTPVHEVPQRWDEVAPPAIASPATAPPAPPARAEKAPRAADWSSFWTLASLRDAVLEEAPATPFADGNPEAGLMLVGEAPSAADLASGRPFSGPAGQFLDRMLAAIGIDRSSCYIGLLCPRQRHAGPASPEAVAADLELTRAHIRLASPRLLVLLGGKPLQVLTGETAAIGRRRGEWLQVDAGGRAIPALAMFNPAYLLRRPEEKAKAWADLQALGKRLSR